MGDFDRYEVQNEQLEAEGRLHRVTFGGQAFAVNGTRYSSPILFKNWRVVALGWLCTLSSNGGEDPAIHFGRAKSDMGAVDVDYFGKVTVYSEGGEQYIVDGDMYIKQNLGYLDTCAAFQNAGSGATVTWAAGGGGLDVWQTLPTSITVHRPNDHNWSIIPFVYIEAK